MSGDTVLYDSLAFIEDTLLALGISNKLTMRTLLLAEELIPQFLENGTPGSQLRVQIKRSLGNASVLISAPGTQFDPYGPTDTSDTYGQLEDEEGGTAGHTVHSSPIPGGESEILLQERRQSSTDTRRPIAAVNAGHVGSSTRYGLGLWAADEICVSVSTLLWTQFVFPGSGKDDLYERTESCHRARRILLDRLLHFPVQGSVGIGAARR